MTAVGLAPAPTQPAAADRRRVRGDSEILGRSSRLERSHWPSDLEFGAVQIFSGAIAATQRPHCSPLSNGEIARNLERPRPHLALQAVAKRRHPRLGSPLALLFQTEACRILRSVGVASSSHSLMSREAPESHLA